MHKTLNPHREGFKVNGASDGIVLLGGIKRVFGCRLQCLRHFVGKPAPYLDHFAINGYAYAFTLCKMVALPSRLEPKAAPFMGSHPHHTPTKKLPEGSLI